MESDGIARLEMPPFSSTSSLRTCPNDTEAGALQTSWMDDHFIKPESSLPPSPIRRRFPSPQKKSYEMFDNEPTLRTDQPIMATSETDHRPWP